jgi:hypothetical protein
MSLTKIKIGFWGTLQPREEGYKREGNWQSKQVASLDLALTG